MSMQGLMKFHQGLLKILRKQNVTDERTDGRTDNVKTVYPPTNTVCGGYKNTKCKSNRMEIICKIKPKFSEGANITVSNCLQLFETSIFGMTMI